MFIVTGLILIILHSKNCVLPSTMATPPQLGIYLLRIMGDSLSFNAILLKAVVVCHGFMKWILANYKVLQIHCSLVEVWGGSKCVPFSAEPTYKGLQQALGNLLNDLDALPDHGPKLCKLVHKLALHRK